MIEETYTREHKSYTDFLGTTPEGLPLAYFDCHDLEESVSKGQLVRDAPEEIVVRFTHDNQGRAILASIDTKMKRFLIANNGDILAATAYPMQMQSNATDKLSFAGMFWGAISRFVANGRVRAMLGFNRQPLFNAQGARIPDSAYDTTLAPTYDYTTHNADGTPIA